MPSDIFGYVEPGMAGYPGTCIICGFDRRSMIDFKRDIEYHGAVLLCVGCAQELGNVEQLNWVPRDSLDKANDLNESLIRTIQEYEALREVLEDGLLGVARDFTGAFDSVHREGNSEPQNSARTLQKNGEPHPNAGSFGFGQHSSDEAFI